MPFEDELRESTLTKEVVAGRAKAAYEEQLRTKARAAVARFKSTCEYWASQGERSCWSYAGARHDSLSLSGVFYFSNEENVYELSRYDRIEYSDQSDFLKYITEELQKQGFGQARAYIDNLYKTVHVKGLFGWHDKKIAIAKAVVLSTSW